MGTRLDFYVGRGAQAEWLGSVAWDGVPDNFPEVIACSDEQTYRAAVQRALIRDDGTLPEDGWPWPWKNSLTTDFAVAFDTDKVWASCFGHAWFDPQNQPDDVCEGAKVAVFPDMTAYQHVTLGPRSGCTMLVGKQKG